jgi:mannosyl-3-phosphoglycerate phosphatase
MLECADIGIIVANSGATPLPPLPGEITGRIHRTEREGPKGWAEAVTALLDELTSNREPVRNG